LTPHYTCSIQALGDPSYRTDRHILLDYYSDFQSDCTQRSERIITYIRTYQGNAEKLRRTVCAHVYHHTVFVNQFVAENENGNCGEGKYGNSDPEAPAGRRRILWFH